MNGLAFEHAAALGLLALVPVAVGLALATRQERARGGRLVLATLLRGLTLALLALAAAGPSLVHERERAAAVFVLDASASLGERGAAEGLQKIQSLAATLPAGVPVGVVAVASDARVVLELGSRERVPGVALADVAPVGSGRGESTDLARGLRLAEALLASGPSGGASGRIVLVSDGRETRGRAGEEAERLRACGVPVDAVAVPGEAPLDARVSEVSAGASEVREGEGLLVRATVVATRSVRARVTLARDGATRPGWEREVQLEADRPETLAFPERAETRGLHLYEARVLVEGDANPANDRGGCAVLVRGGPAALVVETDGEGEAVARILDAQGFKTTRVAPAAVPGPRELASLDLVVLAGAPLVGPSALSRERAKDLERFVREGGGLLALGGPATFGVGGWADGDLEAALPVVVDPSGRGEQPSVALVIAIDKSGSMRGPKIELAKLAAKAATTGLGPQDELGVAAFNFNNYWIVPLSKLTDPARIRDRIDFQVAGGGTDLMPSLRAARAVLEPSPARVRHFLILTDGIAGDEDAIVAYTAMLAEKKITTSTVAVGEDAEQDFLKRIAAAGHGRHYSADRVRELPRIVLQETLVAAQRAMEEEPFAAKRRASHPVLAGVEVEKAPPLHGLAATRARALAQVLLEGPRERPLLALEEHGLGRSAAWTSDATRGWAGEWLSWPGFAKLLGQVARHVARREGATGESLELEAVPEAEGQVLLRAEVRDALGGFARDPEVEATVLAPDTGAGSSAREVARVRLVPAAPGRAEARVEGLGEGVWVALARGRGGLQATAGFARACPAEYARVGADREALARIAGAGGGSLDPVLLAPAGRTSPEREPLGDLLLLAAALLVPVELATRRLGRSGERALWGETRARGQAIGAG